MMTFENNNANLLKKGLRFLGMVATVSLNLAFFLVLFFRFDLVEEAFTSTPVVGVVCLVVGAAIGFIAGAVVIYLNTVKAVDAREKQISKLQHNLEELGNDYNEACKALARMYPMYSRQEKRAAEAATTERTSKIFGEIADLSEIPEEYPTQDEEVSES